MGSGCGPHPTTLFFLGKVGGCPQLYAANHDLSTVAGGFNKDHVRISVLHPQKALFCACFLP